MPSKEENKNNLFDQSFNNNSFAFHSNTSEFNTQNNPIQNLKLLNTNQSFAGQDALGFVSSSSFGNMNMQINNLLDDIKKHSEKTEIKSSMLNYSNKNKNLMIVPEEKNAPDSVDFDFEGDMFKAKLEADVEKNKFNTLGSLNIMNDVIPFNNQIINTENKNVEGKNIIDLMNNFNTGQMDQSIFDDIIKKENQNVKTVKENNSINQSKSLSDSEDLEEEMGFSIKKISENG